MSNVPAVYGVYPEPQHAQQIVGTLKQNGFPASAIQIITLSDLSDVDMTRQGANYHDDLPARTGSFDDVDLQREADQSHLRLRGLGIPPADAAVALQQIRAGAALVVVYPSIEQIEQATSIVYPASIDTSRLLSDYLSDVLGLEQRILSVVAQHVAGVDDTYLPSVTTLLKQTRTVLEQHTDTLQQEIKQLTSGHTTAELKQTIGTLVGTTTGWLERVSSDSVSGVLRDTYTAMSLASISYAALHAVAHARQQPRIADIAAQHIADYRPLQSDLQSQLPHVVVRELYAQGYVNDRMSIPAVTAEVPQM